MYDVLIIGGGIVGAMAARELAKYQLKILLLEKNAEIGMGVTKANSGIVHAGYDCKPQTFKAKLNVRGNAMYPELATDLGFMFKQNGSLVLAFLATDLPRLEALKQQGIENGVSNLKILFKDEILAMEPHINPEVYAALYAPSAGLVFGPEVAQAAALNAHGNGAQFEFETEVLAISKKSDYYRVATNQTTYDTKVIINAAGLNSDVINNFINTQKYEITPRKGEYYLLDRAAGDIVKQTIFQLPSAKGKGVLILPTVHGNVLVGPSAEFVGDKTDVSTNAATLKYLQTSVRKSVPTAPLSMTSTTFAGLRAKAKAHDDFIIKESMPGFINAVGIDSPGLTAAPAIGEYIAKLVANYLAPAVNETFVKTQLTMPLFQTLSITKQNQLIKQNPAYGRIVCRCEQITEGDVINAIRSPLGAKTLDGIKFKSLAGTGRCQGGFCAPKLIEILAKAHEIKANQVTKRGGNSYILANPEV